jgi:hypothetical protein
MTRNRTERKQYRFKITFSMFINGTEYPNRTIIISGAFNDRDALERFEHKQGDNHYEVASIEKI